MLDIERKIISNRINTKVFSAGAEVYIVGGYLRDMLQGRISKDIDYVVRGDINAFTNVISTAVGGKVVELKEEHMIRIVLRGGITLDFARLKGKLEDDLAGRDFTMNAIAWSPETGIIDPYNGIDDIRAGKIKGICEDNFKKDPLRLLRAYRFGAELGWGIDGRTRRIVKCLNRDIQRSAPERITLEFFKLLNSEDPKNALKMALRDGLLTGFLSISHRKLQDNIKALSIIDSTLQGIPERLKIALKEPFSQGLTLKGLLRLESLLMGSMLNKNRLKLSRAIMERVKVVHKLLSGKYKCLFNKNKIFDTFAKAKGAAFDILVLSGKTGLIHEAERFLKIWKRGIMTSEEIMAITGIKGGPKLGCLINEIKRLQFERILNTKKEAVEWLKYHRQI